MNQILSDLTDKAESDIKKVLERHFKLCDAVGIPVKDIVSAQQAAMTVLLCQYIALTLKEEVVEDIMEHIRKTLETMFKERRQTNQGRER